MKKILIIPLLLLILAIIVAGGVLYWWGENTKPPSASNTPVRFVIPKGRSAEEIGELLYEKKLIKNPLAFKFYTQLTNKAENIQAGEFELAANLSMFEVIEELSGGPLELWVTVPEGLRREEVVEKYVTSLKMNETSAMAFRRDFLKESEGLEGYLFPDTYLFPRDTDATNIISVMTGTFDKKVITELENEIEQSSYTLDQILTMASILEKETKDEDKDERPIVAGILWKRLENDWPLQADATVSYAVSNVRCQTLQKQAQGCVWWSLDLTRQDLEIDSPYNTYKYTGLPPAPINNPGLSSIKAAIDPANTDYWYYIHDENENIHYAASLEEHNENIRVYLGK